MRIRDEELDRIIERALQSDKQDNLPPPPRTREETWRYIRKRLRPNRSTVYAKRAMLLGAAALLLISGSLFDLRKVTAFDWVTRSFLSFTGDAVQLTGSSGRAVPEITAKTPPPPDVEADDFVVTIESHYEEMSLEEARQHTRFEIVLPRFVPDGFVLEGAGVFVSEQRKSDQAVLRYVRGDSGDVFTIKQIYVEFQMAYGISSFRQDTEITETMVNGNKATLFEFKDGNTMLVWDEPYFHFQIEGNLSADDIMAVAESLGPAFE